MLFYRDQVPTRFLFRRLKHHKILVYLSHSSQYVLPNPDSIVVMGRWEAMRQRGIVLTADGGVRPGDSFPMGSIEPRKRIGKRHEWAR